MINASCVPLGLRPHPDVRAQNPWATVKNTTVAGQTYSDIKPLAEGQRGKHADDGQNEPTDEHRHEAAA